MKRHIYVLLAAAVLTAPVAFAQFDNTATSGGSANNGQPTTGNVNTTSGGISVQPNGNTSGNGSNGGSQGNSSSNTTNSSSNIGTNNGANGAGVSQSGGVSGTGAGGGSGNYR